MHSSMTLAAPKPARRPAPRFLLLAGAALVLGGLGFGAQTYLGHGPAPITVTDTSGGATFNFRVTGIPVPGKIQGVTPKLTFSPSDLGAAQGQITVNLRGLDTGIALRDEHARNYLGVAKHPTAIFALSRIEGARTLKPGQTLNATAQGTLDLNGVKVPLSAPIALSYAPDGSAINVSTAFDVTFKQHHISIPGADPQTDVKVAFRLPVRQ
ncbi:hypothetical protein DAETH_38050 (plasmid) [Deinococcus aetherius]|uniref:Lipid/polyisoprenoid-binding YceI-like domain-containing protein n=1 Tax=Deinococcus aetherius TaxID=200252 RepID=A0ABN6RNC5_9DEIO|nr:YceI family protein [Deinococcus aetherius]BDP43836.1 hypothetical protein DAETH_38050 [Deinococcus aetherius]